jgi:hypothetical protein
MTDASKPRFSRCNHIVIPYDARAIDQGSDKVDTGEADEVIDAIAKTVAELTSQQAGFVRQELIEQLMRQIMHYDGEDLCSRLREALTSVRVDWSMGTISTPSPC